MKRPLAVEELVRAMITTYERKKAETRAAVEATAISGKDDNGRNDGTSVIDDAKVRPTTTGD